MKTLSVLSLNLRFGLADDGPNGWEYRKETVLGLFETEAPDIIATQEANNFQIDFLATNLPEYEYIGRRTLAPRFWQHNILFYRTPIACKEDVHFFLSQTPNIPSRSFGSQFPRQCTLGLFNMGNRAFVCIDTHFDFDTPAQMGAAGVIKAQLASFPGDVATILMGDFNATPESPCYRWLTGTETEGKKGLDFQETFGKDYPGTVHHFSGKPDGGYIDWILFRGPIRLKGCEALQEPVDGIYPSDHFPVKAVFEF